MSTKKDGGNKDGPPIIVITKDGNPPKKRAYYPTPMQGGLNVNRNDD